MIIGLTGGIGSGKSVAAAFLKQLGAFVIDADAVSKEVFLLPEVKQKLSSTFPMCIIDGKLSRPLLKQLVFGDDSKRILLNSITHPIIFERILAIINKSKEKYIVIEVPLLFEAGFDKLCDITICISADENVRIKRITKRDNISEDFAKKIIRSQINDNERKKRCNYVILNHDIQVLKEQLTNLWTKIHS